MKCWSCAKEIPDAAERCPHCEAEATPPPNADEAAAVLNLLANMDPQQLGELRDAFENSADGEDFVNRIMIGDCPQCGSEQTGDCENDPDIDDICIARCFACGQLWCPDCGELFKKGATIEHDCPAWEGMDLDMDVDFD